MYPAKRRSAVARAGWGSRGGCGAAVARSVAQRGFASRIVSNIVTLSILPPLTESQRGKKNLRVGYPAVKGGTPAIRGVPTRVIPTGTAAEKITRRDAHVVLGSGGGARRGAPGGAPLGPPQPRELRVRGGDGLGCSFHRAHLRAGHGHAAGRPLGGALPGTPVAAVGAPAARANLSELVRGLVKQGRLVGHDGLRHHQ